MSLLNDALRAAEQRQNRPEAPGAYTGQAATDGRRGPWLWVIVLLLMAGLVATSVYWFQIRNSDSGAPAVAASPQSLTRCLTPSKSLSPTRCQLRSPSHQLNRPPRQNRRRKLPEPRSRLLPNRRSHPRQLLLQNQRQLQHQSRTNLRSPRSRWRT